MSNYTKYLKNVPIMPDAAGKIMGYAEDLSDVSFAELEDIISLDPGLTAKVLKVANSSLYARQNQIARLQTAISLMGFKAIKSLVMLVTASNMYQKNTIAPFYSYFWQHSLITAFIARKLTDITGLHRYREEAFLSGLLHDIGQLALYEENHETYDTIMDFINLDETATCRKEIEMFGTDHQTIGRSIMEEWNFPSVFADVAGEHRSPNIQSVHKDLIVLVSMADILSCAVREKECSEDMPGLLRPYLLHSGLNMEQLAYFQNQFRTDLQEDPLFQECRNLFQLH